MCFAEVIKSIHGGKVLSVNNCLYMFIDIQTNNFSVTLIFD